MATVVFCLQTFGQDDIYVAGSDGGIYLVKPTSCSSKLLGKSLSFYDIAIHPESKILYGVAGNSLYSIDTSNGSATYLFNIGGRFNALEFSDSGILYAMGNYSGNLYSIDISTQSTNNLGNTGYRSLGDLTFYKGKLFLASSSHRLIEINLAGSLSTTDRGPFIQNISALGLTESGCYDGINALSMNKVYILQQGDPSNSFLVCPNIFPKTVSVYGATSLRAPQRVDHHILGSDTFVCSDQEFTLDIPHTPGMQYLWSNGASDTSIKVSSSGQYMLAQTYNDCVFKDSITIYMDDTSAIFSFEDTTLCLGEWIEVGANGDSVHWSDGSNLKSRKIETAGTYALQVFNQSCVWHDSVILRVDNLPPINLGQDTTICSNDSIILHIPSYKADYTWHTGQDADSITISKTGVYGLVGRSKHCTTEDYIVVWYDTIPKFKLRGDTTVCGHDSILLKSPNVSYITAWSTPSFSGILSSYRNIYGHPSNLYVLTGENECGQWKDSVKLDSIYCGPPIVEMPNVFTPNNDGYNDQFTAIHMNGLETPMLCIYNRWGEKIFNTNDLSIGWDGRIAGTNLPESTYFWILTYYSETGELYRLSGTVELLR